MAHAVQHLRRHRSTHRLARAAASRRPCGVRRADGDDDRRLLAARGLPLFVLRPGAESLARGSRRGPGATPVLRPVQPPPAPCRTGSRGVVRARHRLALHLSEDGGGRRHRVRAAYRRQSGDCEGRLPGREHPRPGLDRAVAVLRVGRHGRAGVAGPCTRQRRSSRSVVGEPAGRTGAPDSAHRLQRAQPRIGRRHGRLDPAVSHQRGDRRRAGDRDAAAGGAGVGTAAGGCAPSAPGGGDRAHR